MAVSVLVISLASRPAAVGGRTGGSVVATVVGGLVGGAAGVLAVKGPPAEHAASSTPPAMRLTSRTTAPS